jgi:hypothetical protein
MKITATQSGSAWGLVWIVALLATSSPSLVAAQSRNAGVAPGATGQPSDAGGFSPAEIINRVRAAGYEPRSQPLQRGSAYFVFALDRHYMDVRVTVDANSGRVISATRLAGARYGGPGYEGREVRTLERPPAPPGDIPNRAARTPAAAAQAPVPRARPGEAVTRAVTEATVDPPAAPPPSAPAPVSAAPPASVQPVVIAPTSAPVPAPGSAPVAQQPAMVPIAPLE